MTVTAPMRGFVQVVFESASPRPVRADDFAVQLSPPPPPQEVPAAAQDAPVRPRYAGHLAGEMGVQNFGGCGDPGDGPPPLVFDLPEVPVTGTPPPPDPNPDPGPPPFDPAPPTDPSDPGPTGYDGGGGINNPPLTAPTLIDGECNGLRKALALQADNTKEVKGYVTTDGKVILLPMENNTVNSTSVVWPIRDSDNHVIIPEPYQENGVWKITVNAYIDGVRVDPAPVYDIAYHFHTHPGPPYDPDAPSPDDYATAAEYPGMNQKIVNANNIVSYNSTYATSFSANTCH